MYNQRYLQVPRRHGNNKIINLAMTICRNRQTPRRPIHQAVL
jgi:hypothetical protein